MARRIASKPLIVGLAVLSAGFMLLSTLTDAALAEDCHTSSIIKPTPFMGNNGEIFQLSDGSLWQVKYEYEYLYEYYPGVVVCPDSGKLIIKNKQLNIQKMSSAGPGNSAQAIESRIDGEFNGWEGETIYKLMNGQIWQQASAHIHIHIAISPEVLIYRDGGGYKMKVMGDDDEPVAVRRLN